MVEQSIIYSVIFAVWNKFLHFYSYSFLCRIMTAMVNFIMTVWKNSFVRRVLLVESGLEEKFSDGVLGRISARFLGFVKKFTARGAEIVGGSRIVTWYLDIFDNLLYMSVRGYGLMFLVFGGIAGYAKFAAGKTDIIFYVFAGCAVLGLAFIVMNVSLAGLYNGSFCAKWLGRFFGLVRIENKKCKNYHPLCFIVFGLFLGLAAVYLELMMFAMVAGGIIGGLLVLYKTEIGVFAAAFLIPLVPTKLVLGLCVITVLSFLLKAFITGKTKIKFNLLDLFVLLFGLILAFSVLISYNMKSSAYVGAVYILFVLFYFAVRNTIDTKQKLLAIISFIVVSGGLVALYGVYQKLTGSYVMTDAWLDTDMFDETLARIYSTLDNPNVLGEYLLFIIPLAFAMLYYFKDYSHKLIAFGIMGVAALCMVYTQSRGAWLGLLFAFAIFVLLNDRKLIWLALIALIFVPLILPQSIIERFLSIGNLNDGSTSYRVNIWMASLKMIAVFWPIGIGPGTDTFMFIYHKYAFNAVYAPHSHNLFLQIIIDLGIVGLILFICVISGFFKSLLVRVTESKDVFIKAAAAAICAGMAGYLLQGLTDYVWYNNRVVAFFWLMIGLSGAIFGLPKEMQKMRRVK